MKSPSVQFLTVPALTGSVGSVTGRVTDGAPLVVDVRDLRVNFPSLIRPAVAGFNLKLRAGECVALVGESAAGKSVTARALLGLSGGSVRAQQLSVLGYSCVEDGQVVSSERFWVRVRRAGAALIMQDALSGLDPLRSVGAELRDAIRPRTTRGAAHEPMVATLETVGMRDAQQRLKQRAGQLSGGMRQRALIAQALLAQPRLLIADEATTALDARLTGLVLEHLRRLRDRGCAVIMISHDLNQVARVADRVLVMRGGEVVEQGPTGDVLKAPRHSYTRMLLASVPDGVARGVRLLEPAASARNEAFARRMAWTSAGGAPQPVLEARGLTKRFRDFVAVDDVSLDLVSGATLGIVGESGCGKTTTARLLLGLLTPDSGEVRLGGKSFAPQRESRRRALRQHLGAIYQDPLASFDPRYRCGQILASAISAGVSCSARRYRREISELLVQVGLDEEVLTRHARELSGGQRQRLAIARALARHPQVLVFDEPVSALDVSIQARILDLLDEIQERTGAAYLFISHDLSVVQHMCDEVAVMHCGRIVERGATAEVFTDPQHSYTGELLGAR